MVNVNHCSEVDCESEPLGECSSCFWEFESKEEIYYYNDKKLCKDCCSSYEYFDQYGEGDDPEDCPDCLGSGAGVSSYQCKTCGGTGEKRDY